MSAIALNKLLEYILSLSLSDRNKDWLAGKIIESKSVQDSVSQREIELYSMFGAWSNDAEMDTIEQSIRNGRISGQTRHITAFDEA